MANTTHSRYFNTVKRYYKKGWYTVEDVAKFVRQGDLSAEEFEEITGEPYEE